MFLGIKTLFINVERILRGNLTEVELSLNVKSAVNLMLTNNRRIIK
jgi:hypothetical protein